ncbi:MAG: outer membrane beta-barrel protein [Bacteroidota bacterium]
MSRYVSSALIMVLCSFPIFAQEFSMSGKVVDSLGGMPLEAATIYAETVNDSTLVTYTISDREGNFELKGRTTHNKLRVVFSFTGYKTEFRTVEVKPVLVIGRVPMVEQAEALQGVDVVAEKVPIRIKKDTTEYNADSFKVRPDASVEEVLKRLPGVEVDSDGNITVNGKEVDNVLVNGQVFFSNDPKVATKSLPKDLIEKIQIVDTKTRKQQFTGEDADGDTKTINLTIKEDRNKGYMGRSSLGYGTDERYQANGLLNYFNDTQRASFIGGSNNINNSGFSYDEIYEMVGNGSNGSTDVWDTGILNNFGQGITTSSNLGGSYAAREKGKYEIDANYFFAYSDSFQDERNSRENILPEGSFFSETVSRFDGSTNANRGSANVEFDIGTNLRVSLSPNLSVNQSNSNESRESSSQDENGNLVNSSDRVLLSENVQRNFGNEFDLIRKLDTLGGYLSFMFRNTNTESKSVDLLNNVITVYDANGAGVEERVDQRTDVDNDRERYGGQLEYRRALGSDWFLDFEYNFDRDSRHNNRRVFELDDTSGDYTLFRTDLSSDFSFTDWEQQPEIGLMKRGEKMNLSINVSYQRNELSNRDILRESTFEKNYENMVVNSSFRHQLGKNGRVRFSYRSRVDLPQVNQLQPVPNVSDPLNVVVGNPDLDPTLSHDLRFSCNNYDWKERTGYYMYSGLTIQDNTVASRITTDAELRRTTEFTNVNGNYNGYGGLGYSKQFKRDSLYTLGFSLGSNVNFGRQVNFSNGAELVAQRFDISPRASARFNFRELLEVEPGYRVTFSNTAYSLDNVNDVQFVVQRANLRLTTYWPAALVWGNDLSYTYNGNVGPGFKKDALFWNLSVGLGVLKKKGNLKITAYDLLDQNQNVRRTSGQDFIQDVESTVLNRYFMASFSYKFDSFGGKVPQNKRKSRYRRI